jgi:hypothetical protein
MAAPISLVNSEGQALDTMYEVDGTPRLKLAVGEVTGAGLTPKEGWQGVATHQDADTFVALDGVVVAAGVLDGGTTVIKLAVDATGRLQITTGAGGSLTDRSGTVAVGGTQQTLAGINSVRRYLLVQNIDDGEDLWINFTTVAVTDQPSIRLGPGESFTMEGSFVSPQLVSVIAATSGHKFTAKEG